MSGKITALTLPDQAMFDNHEQAIPEIAQPFFLYIIKEILALPFNLILQRRERLKDDMHNVVQVGKDHKGDQYHKTKTEGVFLNPLG